MSDEQQTGDSPERKNRPRKKDDMLPFRQALLRVSREQNWHHLGLLVELRNRWPEIAGLPAADFSEPSSVRRGVLQVAVASAIWMQELHACKALILARIQQLPEAVEITDMRLYLLVTASCSKPPVSFSREGAGFSQLAEPPPGLARFTGMASTIADPACRDALIRLWQCLNQDGGGGF